MIQQYKIIDIQNQQLMQYRYKVGNSYEARKSSTNTPSQSHKNDSLTYINLLDKCTQILREDRIWIRNQLKANDEEVFKIFKQAKRPINLQHLQIRLRKYVAAIKSKAKMEQLIKFKENMHLGDWTHPREDKDKEREKLAQPHHKRQTTNPKYQIPNNCPTPAQDRGLKARMNNSVEKQQPPKPAIYPYRNTSANSKRTMEHYPAPMEQITERESENMTSARNRGFNQDFNYTYSHNIPNNNNNNEVPFSHAYNQWKRPEDHSSAGLAALNNFVADPFKPKMQSSYFNNLMGDKEQAKSKQVQAKSNNSIVSLAQKQKISMSKSENPESKAPAAQTTNKPYLNHAKNTKYDEYQMQNDDELDGDMSNGHESYSYQQTIDLQSSHDNENEKDIQHHNESNQHSNTNNNSVEHESEASSYFNSYSPNMQVEKESKVAKIDKINSFMDTLNLNTNINSLNNINNVKSNTNATMVQQSYSYNIKTTNQLHRQSMEETNLLSSKCANTIGFSSGSANSQSLFTSPQLLAECRNFLKLKSSAKPSTQKQFSNLNRFGFDYQSKVQPLKFDSIEPAKLSKQEGPSNTYSQSSLMSIFANVQCGASQKIVEATRQISNTNIITTTSTTTNNNNKYDVDSKYDSINTISKTNKETKPNECRKQQSILNSTNYVKQTTKAEQPTLQPNLKTTNSGAYQYFHTFSGLSSQKKQPALQLSNAQEFVDAVLAESYEMPQGFVSWDVLEQLVEQRCPQFMDSFKQYLYPTEDEKMVLVSNVGRLLEDLLSEGQSHETDNEVRNMYKLLDIEQKGCITENDIEDFIRQLQDSEAEDIETISQYIWRLFESIDRDTEEGEGKKVDYWGIYARKNQPDFQELNEILKQFQFQIE